MTTQSDPSIPAAPPDGGPTGTEAGPAERSGPARGPGGAERASSAAAVGDTPAKTRRPALRWARRVVSVLLLAAGVVAAYGRRHDIHQAVERIGHPAWFWLVCACVAQASSMVAFARMQRWLLRCGGIRVRLRHMVEITLAGNALSTSVPGGAAWAAGWVWGQLRKREVQRPLASWVVLVAGAMSSFALFLVVVIGAFVAGSHGPVASLRWVAGSLLALAVLGAVAVFAVARSPVLSRWWQRMAAAAADASGWRAAAVRGVVRFTRQVRVITPSPLGWSEALGLALYNWTADLLTLIFVIWTVHGDVPWQGIMVAYGLTQISASIPITPGGLAVVEASLTALLTAYGMEASSAITVVLLYRLVSFWALVPIGWGSWAYLETAKRGSGRHRRWSDHRPVAPSRRFRRSDRSAADRPG